MLVKIEAGPMREILKGSRYSEILGSAIWQNLSTD